MEFRLLKASEIEARVQTVKKNGCSILIYKDARVDMNILDETVGAMNWKREHTRDNANCIVSIWCKEKNQWVSKEDTGTESQTEKEKGQASDSFKRACFNWGIGRELYTAPFVWINLAESEVIESEYQGKNKYSVKTRFEVSEIGYSEQKEINKLIIIDDKKTVRFRFDLNANSTVVDTKKQAIESITKATTKEELIIIWNDNMALQNDNEFKKAVTDRKTQLNIK